MTLGRLVGWLAFAWAVGGCVTTPLPPDGGLAATADAGPDTDLGVDSGVHRPPDAGPGDDAGVAASVLAGLVAVGSPVAFATVSAHCTEGTLLGPVVTVDGAENDLVLHGWARVAGRTNLTPLTEAALAHALAGAPSEAFGGPTPDLSSALLDAAHRYVTTQLEAAHLGPPPPDVFSDAFAVGDPSDGVFDALAAQLGLAHHSLKDLTALSAQHQPWAPVLNPAPSSWAWALPDTLVAPTVPQDNPMSAAKVELGRSLFYEKRLSGNGTTSCATCHPQAKAFSDGLPVSRGSTNEAGTRNAQALGNVAFHATLTWQNPNPRTLEEQMAVPLFGVDPVEMGVNAKNRAEVLARLKADGAYQARFAAAYPGQDRVVSWPNVIRSIAAFERTLLSGNSRSDRALKGRGPPLSAAETRGSNLFFGPAQCFRCHGNFNFSDVLQYQGGPPPDPRFHNTGLFNLGGTGAFPVPNRGIFEFTGVATDMGRFRAPSLRNVELTAPYMHDGSVATLEDVLDFYGDHGRVIETGPNAGDGRASPFKEAVVNDIALSAQDKADLVAFLKTLTDDEFVTNPALADPQR